MVQIKTRKKMKKKNHLQIIWFNLNIDRGFLILRYVSDEKKKNQKLKKINTIILFNLTYKSPVVSFERLFSGSELICPEAVLKVINLEYSIGNVSH